MNFFIVCLIHLHEISFNTEYFTNVPVRNISMRERYGEVNGQFTTIQIGNLTNYSQKGKVT